MNLPRSLLTLLGLTTTTSDNYRKCRGTPPRDGSKALRRKGGATPTAEQIDARLQAKLAGKPLSDRRSRRRQKA